MNRLRIVHTTGFRYAGDASASYNEARMLPTSTSDQVVLYAHLDISPLSAQYGYVDYFGTQVTSFEVLHPHKQLSLTATSLVEVHPQGSPVEPATWSALTDAAGRGLETVEQLASSPRCDPTGDVSAIAAAIAAEEPDPHWAALRIARTLAEQMEYVPGATWVGTTAAEAWAAKKGVCQDIVHLVLGALRSVGIPARYVSGYLHPLVEPGLGETVVGESHAWIEWFDGARWSGWDPTNLIDIGDRHVRVGTGRDYADVAPLRGIYSGASDSELFVRVEITREA